MPIRISEIIDRLVAYHPKADTDLVRKAYVWSAKLHAGQLRKSGLPYLSHPLEVAGILTELQLYEDSIAAGLLHDTVEDSEITVEQLSREFGPDIAALVDGVTKITLITQSSRSEKQAENLRKMILAMARDIRVILIKLSDRLDNMRTLEVLPEDRQVAIARETQDIYAPLAARLGIFWLKAELEDYSFKFTKPEIYSRLVKQVAQSDKARKKLIENVSDQLQGVLEKAGIRCDVKGRPKHYYSIYQKMERQKLDFEQVYDLLAFRVLVPTINDCYDVFRVVHSLWTPMHGRVRDYIAQPKPNMYQSLHTTVLGPEGHQVEIQIRTHEMHRVAEFGIASHWKYKEGGTFADEEDEKRFAWLRRLVEFDEDLKDPHQFLDSVRAEMFSDEVYVFTPGGEVRDLPVGSTPIDFAFSIHTDIGNRCAGAKVNGRIVSLETELKSGDIVEILTSKEAQPVKAWLDIAATARAKTKIRHWISNLEVKRSSEMGRSILEGELLRYDIHLKKAVKSGQLERIVKEFNFPSYNKMLESIGYGNFSVGKVIARMVPPESLRRTYAGQSKKTAVKKKSAKAPAKKPAARPSVEIDDLDDPLISFGGCCNPVPGDEIIGFSSEGHGVEVHRSTCKYALDLSPDKRVAVNWSVKVKGMTTATLEIVAMDQPGMLHQLTGAISAAQVNISRALVRSIEDNKALNTFDIQIKDAAQLRIVVAKLEKIQGVISVSRTKLDKPAET